MKKKFMIMGFITVFLILFIFRGEGEQQIPKKSEEIAECFRVVYEEAKGSQMLGTPKVMGEILDCFKKEGYTVVDLDNQFDMVNPEPMELFCRQAEEGKEAKATVCVIIPSGGFHRYDFHSLEGKVQVTRSFIGWDDGEPVVEEIQEYEAGVWTWFGGAYLFFEEELPWDFDGTSRQIALRLKPLDQKLRELNRKYVEPIGYYLNNMFVIDWSENDYGELNFYDLFQPLYEMKYGETDFLELGYREDQVYEVPRSIFEAPFRNYFQIDSDILKEKNVYDEQSKTYQYRPRGLYDGSPSAGTPCPEVIAYEELEDGTLKLIVQAVWKSEQIEKAFVHELVVRPISEGKFQYVSNRVIPSEENVEPAWYVERYSDCPVVIDGFYENMQNYEKMDDFLNVASEGKPCEQTIYILHENQGFGRYCFGFDGEKMSLRHTIFSWSENGKLLTTGTFLGGIQTWSYSDTGWFCYELDMPQPPMVSEIINGNEMIRIKPLKKEYREIAEMCLLPIGYQGNNLFCSEWDDDHMEDLDYNGLYEYLYALEHGEKMDAGEYAVYDFQTGSYGWAELGCGNYSPDVFGMSVPEIDGIIEIEDEMLHIQVRAVCEPLGTDRIFEHELTVRLLKDGGITYMGNHITKDELDRSMEYQYRLGKPD